MGQTILAKLTYRDAPWRWGLWTDYDPELVAAIKNRIPMRFRKWDGQRKCWLFMNEAIREVLFITEQYCGTVEQVEDNATRDLSQEDVEAYMLLHVLPSAPKEVIRAAYKAMALLAHPDRGGSTAQMQAINSAYQRLMREGEYA